MKITASPANRDTGSNYTVYEKDPPPPPTADKDGNLTLTLTSRRLTLSGQFIVQFNITRAEIENWHRTSLAADYEKRIAALEAEIKAMKSKLPA